MQRNFTELPIPQSIITKVNAYATKEDRPDGLTIQALSGNPFNFPDDAPDGPILPTLPAPYPDLPNEFPGIIHTS